MPLTKFVFIVPEDVGRLGEILCDEGGTLEYEDYFETYDQAIAYLSERSGKMLMAQFEDVDDTLQPLNAFADELDSLQAPYLGTSEAFEERSRRERADGYIVYHLFDGQTQRKGLPLQWSLGDPELHERTLKAAGMADDEIAKIVERLLDTPAPAPAAPAMR